MRRRRTADGYGDLGAVHDMTGRPGKLFKPWWNLYSEHATNAFAVN